MRVFNAKSLSWSIVVSAWLVIAYSRPLLSALEQYQAGALLQLKIGLLLWLFYAAFLSLSRALGCFKVVAIALIMIAAPVSFFMQQYGVVIDPDMLVNTIETDIGETADLLSLALFQHLFLLGVLPSILIWKFDSSTTRWSTQLGQGVLASTLLVAVMSTMMYTNYDDFASLFRNHRDIKYRIVPFNAISSTVSVIKQHFDVPTEFVTLGTDAVQRKSMSKPKVMVVIVGETARADHFSVNGYARLTTPKLNRLAASGQILSYTNAISCGTATAISVPCMFSFATAETYNDTVRSSSNVLDVLKQAGISATWIENNSGCKNVCDRIETTVLDQQGCAELECFDNDMVTRLSALLQETERDRVIVLHQMGSHGPAYYKRSPQSLKQFQPECESADLTACSKEQIINAYDNSLLVTDALISGVIELLQTRTDIDASMMYVSDHGESLGDHGIYLHGLPNWMAPAEQRQIPWIVWPTSHFKNMTVDNHQPVSHDYLAHTLLGFFEVETALYDHQLDLIDSTGSVNIAHTTP
ncbi:phosphoethanolamine transferase [Pseudidiomarina aestuarii]|uniref:Phosphoethanolamine transferase n=1 Tax=Pseudidiomarina aestuarii TaxID=624146 RepID=A0A2T4D3Z9_9GAMM|nr:phosphoethanolamine transferase [Pseudidiomarina aestuarii]PTB88529.1 phosphoethanolamine transferase [Pseudidiomarina aestuarii]PTB90287.1 phosphoethanolamine transferase [Pseudidiomarina aestuarii]